jgi:hypothetical protein
MSNLRIAVALSDPLDAPTPPPSSCGLDFWQSDEASDWVCGYLDARPASLQVVAGGRSASLRLLLRRLPLGMRLATAYPYGCIEGDVDTFWRATAEIGRALRNSWVAALEIPFSGEYAHQFDHASRVDHHGAPKLDAVRHVLDLRSREASTLEQGFHPNIRWSLRKASRNGCSVRRAVATDIDVLQSLYVRTMRTKRAPVNYGPQRFGGIVNVLQPSGTGCVYVGEIDGEPRGMAAVVDGRHSRHLVQLAVPPESHATRIGELLTATAITDAVRLGRHFFDFMASSSNDAGLIAYKAKWGAVAEPIRYSVLPGVAGMPHLVRAGRWLNKAGARLRGD